MLKGSNPDPNYHRECQYPGCPNPVSVRARFCSGKCRVADWKARHGHVEAVKCCPQCGFDLTKKSRNPRKKV